MGQQLGLKSLFEKPYCHVVNLLRSGVVNLSVPLHFLEVIVLLLNLPTLQFLLFCHF